MELSVNSFLQGGKYRIVRYISSGGFGCTYEAEHVLLGKRVAIKEFFVKDFCNRDERTSQVTVGTESKKGLVEKLRRKFIDEARALSGLHHPGIVSVSDVFEENGTAYYVMDYIDGCSLSDLVRREGPLSESRALGYIRQVCAALSYVHAHGRLHLDIKPGNIMVDQEGNAILIDFGASKQYDECGGENTSTLMGRTPGYAPLEQLGNDVVKFLPATDIYAVGATLYKLLTGVTPLSANRLASGESLPPLPAQVSASTRKAVESAMCLNKMQRPQSVSVFLSLLDGNSDYGDETEITLLEDDVQKVSKNDVSKEQRMPVKHVFAAFQESSLWTFLRQLSRRTWLVVGFCLFAIVLSVYFLSGVRSDSGTRTGLDSNEKLTETTGTINGHDYVDLGLPSGLKWATCNVGAFTSEGIGDYYSWGETRTKSEYIEDNANTYKMNVEDISGNEQYDVARAQWGSPWRLPTKSECEELVNKCKWEWANRGGSNGYLVTGPNGESIFFPASGFTRFSDTYDCDEGYFWCSTPVEEYDGDYSYSLYFSNKLIDVNWNYRFRGLSVRPVSD